MQIGEIPLSTDAEGRFLAQVAPDQDAAISSGLKAIKFDKIAGEEREVLEGTGEQIAAIAAQQGGLIVVDASRRVNPEPICRAYSADTGAEMLWFRYTNRYGEVLSVPQAELNSLLSPSGQPYPVSEFKSTSEGEPDGLYGFEWSIEFFTWFKSGTNQEMVSAAWKLLGTEVAVEQPKEEIPFCASPAELLGCYQFSSQLSNRVFEQTLLTVSRLSSECDKAKKRGLWKPKGTFRNPFLGQSARSLRAIRELLRRLPRNRYICENVAPAGCSMYEYPKAELLGQFDKILRVKLPKGLERITRFYAPERRKFLAELRKQPDRFYSCDR